MGVWGAIKGSRLAARLVHNFPPGQFARYFVVGVCNTLFSYGSYAALTAVLMPYIPFAYVVASVTAGLLSITFSYLMYKRFVFKTKGGYLREWLRCIVVYGGVSLPGVVLLPLFVYLLRHFTPADKSAPYIAGAMQLAVGAIAGFLSHKNFSFAPPRGAAERPSN